ncbi:GIP [Symbiodinium sp. CCMP2592]|nr:GIP [Symbiodinium sp. CCMP2592]
MTRLTRQLILNQAMIRKWTVFSADVRTAFLQARPPDRGRRLLAKPLPELAQAMNLTPEECDELTGSAYGLTTAPREWFQDVAGTIQRLGGRQCKTDPCAWVILNAEHEVVGYLSSHVDDFLVTGNQEDGTWLKFVQAFKSAYKWSPWQDSDFLHCGLRVIQHEDKSFTLDHSTFSSDLNQMPPADSQQTQMNENQDVACIEHVNKLVREVHGQGKINVVSWRSFRLPRVARISLSAEAQALGHCEQELMFARLEWHELNGGTIDVRNPADSTSKVPGHIIIDARGVYDALEKADPGMASFNVKDKYTSLELMGINENLRQQKTALAWCDSDHQLADGLTKASKLRHPGAFMSAKKRRSLEASKA